MRKQKRSGNRLAVAIAQALSAFVATPVVALAQSKGSDNWVVNSLGSTVDGVCDAAADGCTLADALIAANQNVSMSTISFDPAIFGGGATLRFDTAPDGTALPALDSPIAIVGLDGLVLERDAALGCAVDGQQTTDEFRLLHVGSRAELTMTDVSLRGGCVDGGEGGAILADGPVTLRRVTLSGNTATAGGGASFKASVVLDQVTVSGNSAAGNGGGLAIAGVTVGLVNATVTQNTAGLSGAGIYASQADVQIEASTVDGNTATLDGGGLHSLGSDLMLTRSTISGNSAGNQGGGLSLIGDLSGGGHVVADATVAYNQAPDGASLYAGDVTISLQRNIVASTFQSQCLLSAGSDLQTQDVLSSDDSCLGTTVGLSELNLLPLADQGGPGATHALGRNSVAIDAAQSGCGAQDQRGLPRPFDGDGDGSDACDIGAFEVQELSQAGNELTVNSAAGSLDGICGAQPGECSLPDAMAAASADPAATHINFDATVQGATVTLTNVVANTASLGASALAPLTAPLTIDGGPGGVTVERSLQAPCMRFLSADGHNLTLSNITLNRGCAQGSDAAGSGGAIFVRNADLYGATVFLQGNSAQSLGGGIYLRNGSAILDEITISGNTANSGGGLHASEFITATLANSTISANTAAGQGGGIYAAAGSLTISDSIISGNTANSGGGVFGTQVLANFNTATLMANTAFSDGGGIYAAAGSLAVTDSTITGNTANSGGGLYGNQAVTVTLNSGSVAANTATMQGGGLALGTANLTVTDTLITGNTADAGGGVFGAQALANFNTATLMANTAFGQGGGIYAAAGSLTVTDATITGNTASIGGGIRGTNQNTATLTGGTLNFNTADVGGGALIDFDSVLQVSRATIAGNTASGVAGHGAGIHLSGGQLYLGNSRLTGNSASGSGGGLYLAGAPATVIADTTLAGNSADVTGAQLAVGIGGATGQVLRNVFQQIAGAAKGAAAAGNCLATGLDVAADNFSTDSSCGSATVVSSSNMNLQPDTQLPGPGSVLVDAASGCSGLDQRGLPRGVDADGIAGDDCDIGGVEVQNTPVVAFDDAASTDQNSTTGGNLLGNDQDTDDEDSGVLSVTGVNAMAAAIGSPVALAQGGRLTVHADGGYLFDPANDFVALNSDQSAMVSAAYTVSDGYAVDEGQLEIQIVGVNDPPDVVDDRYPATQGSILSVPATGGLLANDTDVDGDLLTVITTGAFTPSGAGGTLTVSADGSFQFQAPVGTGQSTFEYTASDGDSNRTATLILDVATADSADLRITKTDGVDFVQGNEVLTYTIRVVNLGPADVVGAQVQDSLPADLQNASWTCEVEGTGQCVAAGSGDIDVAVDINVGAAVQFELVATTPPVLGGSTLTNTATVVPPVAITEINIADNTAADVNATTLVFRNGFEDTPIAKSFSAGHALIDSATLKRQLRFADQGQPRLLLRAIDSASPDLAMALVHGRREAGGYQVRISRLDQGEWRIGRWQPVSGQVVDIFW